MPSTDATMCRVDQPVLPEVALRFRPPSSTRPYYSGRPALRRLKASTHKSNLARFAVAGSGLGRYCWPMKRAMLRWELMLRLTAACVVLAAALSHLTPARAEPQGGAAGDAGATGDTSAASDEAAKAATTEPEAKAPRPSIDDICRTLAEAAADNELPEEFFTRLIWQESRFDPMAISPAGAQGIAQFMPQTATMRGLTNAFEPLQALRESASYLRELRTTFRGNLGLAAARRWPTSSSSRATPRRPGVRSRRRSCSPRTRRPQPWQEAHAALSSPS
jgi:hypothetical protein